MKQGIPKSARDQLAKDAATGEHPSADLLNAFAEHSVSAAEKQRVTSHLAACAECREVVFLAGAAPGEEEQAALVEPASLGWRSWLSWKWVVPTVAALAIAAGVTLQHERAGKARVAAPNPTLAMNQPAPEQERDSRNEIQSAQSQPDTVVDNDKKTAPAQTRADKSDKFLDEMASAKPQSVPNRDSTAVGANLPPAFYSSSAATPSNAVNAPPPPPALAAKEAPPSKDAVPRALAAPSSSGKTELAESSNMAAPASAGDSSAKVLRKSKAATTEAAGGPSQVAAARQAQQALQQKHQTSDAEAGQASKAKETDVAAEPSPIEEAKSVTVPFSSWQITPDGHLEHSSPSGEWKRVLADQPVSFRSVALVGDEVWAGGNDGALFHSTDGGEQWTKVLISPDEHSAIVSIRFDSTSEGTVSTAASVHWSTRDGGKTWERQ